MDYRHHWQDVLVGSLLGLTMAFFAYRQYYPPLSSPRSQKPFSPRVPRDAGDEYPPTRSGTTGTEAGRPILPTTRAEGELRADVDSSVGHGEEARRGEEGGLGEGIGLTHPANPHMHFTHARTHSGASYREYRDDGETDDLMQPSTSFDTAVKREEGGIELNRT